MKIVTLIKVAVKFYWLPLWRSRSSANESPSINPKDLAIDMGLGELASTSTRTGGYYDRDSHHQWILWQ